MKNQGVLVAAIVALVALVGLVTVFNQTNSTAAVVGDLQGDLHCQLVVTEAGVGSYLCRSDFQYPTFDEQYLREPKNFEKYDRFKWQGK